MNWEKEIKELIDAPYRDEKEQLRELYKVVKKAIKEDRKKNCECTEEETTGATTQWCCNICGKIQLDNG